MLGFDLAHIPWTAPTNLEVWQSYNALPSKLGLPSTGTLSNICGREYLLTGDAIKKQLPSLNKVSLALDSWTSMNTSGIPSVIAYYIDQKWAMRQVQLAFNEVGCLFSSYFRSWLQMIGPGSMYWSKASRTVEGSSWLVLATGPDRQFGSGSGSKLNRCRIGCPGRQHTRTAHSGTVSW